MPRIGIIGRMASGKTTLAQEILRESKRFAKDTQASYTRLSFASKVKALTHELFPDQVATSKPRHLYQCVATQMKVIDPDVWVKAVVRELPLHTHIVIDDVRHDNEFTSLRKHGFKMIYLDVSDDIRLQRLKQAYPDHWQEHVKHQHHASECVEHLKSRADYVIEMVDSYI